MLNRNNHLGYSYNTNGWKVIKSGMGNNKRETYENGVV